MTNPILDTFGGDRSSDAVSQTTGDGQAAFRSFAIRTRLVDVVAEDVTWLWPRRIPYGKLTLIVGDPGLGKSFVTLDVAARLSAGTPWPDQRDAPVQSGNVVLLSAEDDLGDTIRPRLDAAGADVTRIHAITAVQRSAKDEPRYFSLDDDLCELDRCIIETDARLCVVDPVSAYLGGRDSHCNADMRGLLAPLAGIAARRRCAVVCVSHLNKSAAQHAIYRTMGSLAFTAAARIAWLVARDPDDPQRRLLLPIKSNLIQDPTGIAFRIVDGVVHWDSEPVQVDADSVLTSNGTDRTQRTEAEDWLTRLLAVGPMPVNEIRKAAEADSHAWRTVERAKNRLGVVSRREGFGENGRFTWELRTAVEDGPS
ncbi:MAG: AAA family ATPase [Planctomycetota bacterium]|jgi:hypothetical protein